MLDWVINCSSVALSIAAVVPLAADSVGRPVQRSARPIMVSGLMSMESAASVILAYTCRSASTGRIGLCQILLACYESRNSRWELRC